MAEKCKICKKKLGETFLNKKLGTVVKDSAGKRNWVCFECQKNFQTKEEILKQLQTN